MPLSDTDRSAIFKMLTDAMLACCPPMVNNKNGKDGFEIIGNIPVPYGHKKEIIPGMYFASAVPRKDMVSFYLFPLYGHNDAFSAVAPTAMKCLKGKTCFNFKKPEQINRAEIDTLLKKGMEVWRDIGYLK